MPTRCPPFDTPGTSHESLVASLPSFRRGARSDNFDFTVHQFQPFGRLDTPVAGVSKLSPVCLAPGAEIAAVPQERCALTRCPEHTAITAAGVAAGVAAGSLQQGRR